MATPKTHIGWAKLLRNANRCGGTYCYGSERIFESHSKAFVKAFWNEAWVHGFRVEMGPRDRSGYRVVLLHVRGPFLTNEAFEGN